MAPNPRCADRKIPFIYYRLEITTAATFRFGKKNMKSFEPLMKPMPFSKKENKNWRTRLWLDKFTKLN